MRSATDRLPNIIRNAQTDRKSTRLNSSHQIISYAVFCLKKKKNYQGASVSERNVAPRVGEAPSFEPQPVQECDAPRSSAALCPRPSGRTPATLNHTSSTT